MMPALQLITDSIASSSHAYAFLTVSRSTCWHATDARKAGQPNVIPEGQISRRPRGAGALSTGTTGPVRAETTSARRANQLVTPGIALTAKRAAD